MAKCLPASTRNIMSLSLGGFEVLLERKSVKNINLRVRRDGTVYVSAPRRLPLDAIERFVVSRADWIASAQSHVHERAQQAQWSAIDGQTIFIWGEPHVFELRTLPASGRRPSCSFSCHDGHLTCIADERIATSSPESLEARDKQLSLWLREEVRNHTALLLPTCEEVVGQHCAGVRFRTMKSRWGSCNVSTRLITLNDRLVHHDPKCLEYVIFHELCHLLEPSHNARFHALMDQFCPDWRERKNLLEQR